jgi:hypothetical protein
MSLLPLLVLLVPGQVVVAGPPERVSGRMVLDEVADGLRRYRMEKDEEKRAAWLFRLGDCRDARVVVVMGEGLSDPSEQIQHAATLGILRYADGPDYEDHLMGGPNPSTVWAKKWWRLNEAELRRQAKKPP